MLDRTIGRIVSVDSFRIMIELERETKSLYKSGYQDIYEIARINSYVILPVGADRVVALVTRVRINDETDLDSTGGVVFLPTSKRLIQATMIGTILSTGEYIQGIYNFPTLDNPVWYILKEDLAIIFDYDKKEHINFKKHYFLPIGTCPAFSDFEVKINPDKLFNKHAAVLGNTGSGKSCTIASLLQSIFRFKYNDDKGTKTVNNAHIVIFDTNGEYRKAFNFADKELNKRVNTFYIGQDGLQVPYWFMNYDDFDYLFKPSAQTQAPILKNAISIAKENETTLSKKNIMVEKIIDQVIALVEKEDWIIQKYLHNQLDQDILYLDSVDNPYIKIFQKLPKANAKKPSRHFDISLNRRILDSVIKELAKIREKEIIRQAEEHSQGNINIDLPVYFSFREMYAKHINTAIRAMGESQSKYREYLSSLRLRLSSFYSDERVSIPLMLKSAEIPNALSLFLRYITGMLTLELNDSTNLTGNKSATVDNSCSKTCAPNCFKSYRNKKKIKSERYINVYDPSKMSQITIIDMSLLPYEVLENVTGLIARLILEFLQRIEKVDGDQGKRGSFPVVLVLEEAQNYIPESDKDKEHISISKRVFERIAREGRKYGLSLLISSQRPAELSKTVLSQCNTFIVHRLQNPDDQRYVRQLVSSATEDILNQLPILPQQHAIIMGDAVRSPVQVRINNVNPKPASDDPAFFNNWVYGEDVAVDFDKVSNVWLGLQKPKNKFQD